MIAMYSLKTLALEQTVNLSNIVTKGIVISEKETVKAERILTLYTEKKGVIECFARNAKGTKNALFSGLSILHYCEFTIAERKGVFTVKEAETLHSFFSLTASMEGVALALYLAELIRIVRPSPEEAVQHLPFFLNTLHLIGKKQRDLDIYKVIFELRTMAGHGFMPMLVACSCCCEYKESPHNFDYKSGKILCNECAQYNKIECNITSADLAAMRHIVFSDLKHIFSFEHKKLKQKGLVKQVEKFTFWHLDKKPQSLNFYYKLSKEQQPIIEVKEDE